MAECRYRQTRAGDWVVVGPPSVVKPGATVQVRTARGRVVAEKIVEVGKPFVNDKGEELVYGYKRPRENKKEAGDEFVEGGEPF